MYHFNVNVKIVIVFHFSISSNFLWETIACTIYHLRPVFLYLAALGPFLTSNFTYADSNANEQKQ